MRVAVVDPADAEARLAWSRDSLRTGAADLSAARLLDRRQKVVVIAAAVLFVALLVLDADLTLIVLVAIATFLYVATVIHRVHITMKSRQDGQIITVSAAHARAIPDSHLPIYTVLVPAYREPEVVAGLFANLRALEYPADRLDVKVLLEADDEATIAEAMRQPDTLGFEVVLVPPGEPRTKPKALNYGLTLARGEFVTIYDAEDQPDPLQLRRAVAAFTALPDDVVCLQGLLTYHNTDQNLITRWFGIEYLMWFTLFLPGLVATDAPLPLGGTSNHMRRAVLEGLGAWDPYNVTEDADLGIRLHRQGWRCAVLGSVTYEEANSDFVNWMKQRSRWYKGYLQTWLVNLRDPGAARRELGLRGFLQFNVFVGGTPLLAFLNPFFWGLTVLWFAGRFHFIHDLFPAPVYYAGLVCWSVGNLSMLYLTVLSARRAGRPSLVFAALLVPAYWVMMSLSAVKAVWQLVFTPSYWEKTTHGLGPADATARPATPAGPPEAAEAAGVAVGPAGVTGPAGPAVAAWRAPAVVPAPGREYRPGWWMPSVGRVLTVGGLVVVAFVAFVALGTGLGHHHDQAALAARLRHQPRSLGVPMVGEPVGRVVVPGRGIDVVAVEGTAPAQLDQGPGHVVGTAYPGGRGDAVVVGHRSLYGSPLGRLDRLRAGDPIVVHTAWGTARYRVATSQEMDRSALDLGSGTKPRLTLVSSAGGLDAGRVLVVRATLTSPVDPSVPAARSVPAHLGGPGDRTIALLLAWGALAVVGWWSTRWFRPRWGPVGAALMAAPIVVVAVLGVFQAASHVLPGTL